MPLVTSGLTATACAPATVYGDPPRGESVVAFSTTNALPVGLTA